MKYQIQIVKTTSEFISRKNEWENFEKFTNQNSISSSFKWIENWWNEFENVKNSQIGENKQLLVSFVYQDNKLIAILPFVKIVRMHFGVKISFLEFLSQQWGAIFCDVIHNQLTKQEFNEIFKLLKNQIKVDLIFLKYFTQDSILFDDKSFLYSFCPYIELNKYETFANFESQTYSKRFKNNLRTARNRIKNEEIKYETIKNEVKNSDIDEIISVSDAKKKDQKGNLYDDVSKRSFYTSIFTQFSSQIIKQYFNDKMVAYGINIVHENSTYYVDASYDRAFKKYELGNFTFASNINDGFDKKSEIFYFGHGIDEYKLRFTSLLCPTYMMVERGNTILGFVYQHLFSFLAKRKSKKLLNYLMQNPHLKNK